MWHVFSPFLSNYLRAYHLAENLINSWRNVLENGNFTSCNSRVIRDIPATERILNTSLVSELLSIRMMSNYNGAREEMDFRIGSPRTCPNVITFTYTWQYARGWAGVDVGGCACVIGISSETGVGFGAGGGGVAGDLLIISTTWAHEMFVLVQ